MNEIEETDLVPSGQVLYQFSARGHDLAQIILGSLLTHPHDASSGYYRSRPLLLTLGLDLVDAVANPMGKSGGFSNGRDIGVVCNLPALGSAKVLPMAGGVGSQYTPTAGWAQAIKYRSEYLKDSNYDGAISVVLGGDGSVATNGFWSALTMATTQNLPMIFYIEDNAFGLSVPSGFQTPGGNIAENLANFGNLNIVQGDGTHPKLAYEILRSATEHTRSGAGPSLVRLTVPRLCGHSAQDTQAYKSPEVVSEEQKKDPLPKFKEFFLESGFTASEWDEIRAEAQDKAISAVTEAKSRPEPTVGELKRFIFTEKTSEAKPDIQLVGGLAPEEGWQEPEYGKMVSEPTRINMLTAIRRTLDSELARNSKLVVFGEDVGPKGGVHGATLGLQEKYGNSRVFDTSLSEEGIIGRAVGMAYCGLMPVTEIQFRKYADPAQEQITDCGTIRWRTYNQFAAPIVVRVPGGHSKCGDPWHSMCDEVMWAHMVGWQVAFPSNAADAVGLLRTAMRSNDPTIFFEHRNLLDAAFARRPYPGDDYLLPFGEASFLERGKDITIVSWGSMLEKVVAAVKQTGTSADVIDLRSIFPWDREAVLSSAETTGRCLIVHEDQLTAGFGAEVAAVVASEAFLSLKAPVERLAMEDFPCPYNVNLLAEALPSVDKISDKMRELLEY